MPSGFRDYLLNPRPVDRCLGCRLTEQRHRIVCREMRRSVGSGNATHPIRFSGDTMLISSQGKSLPRSVGRKKSWAVSCDIWPLSPVPPTTFPPLRYIVEPAAGRNLLQEWTPGWGQRSRPSASCFQSSSLSFKSPRPRPRPPPAVF